MTSYSSFRGLGKHTKAYQTGFLDSTQNKIEVKKSVSLIGVSLPNPLNDGALTSLCWSQAISLAGVPVFTRYPRSTMLVHAHLCNLHKPQLRHCTTDNRCRRSWSLESGLSPFHRTLLLLPPPSEWTSH